MTVSAKMFVIYCRNIDTKAHPQILCLICITKGNWRQKFSRHPAHPERRQWAFTYDSDKNKHTEIVVAEHSARKYAHSPSEACKIRDKSPLL